MKSMLRESYTRPPSDRMRRIHEWIKTGKYPNAVTIDKDLEVTDRTVKRDIDFMRDRYGLLPQPALSRNVLIGDSLRRLLQFQLEESRGRQGPAAFGAAGLCPASP